MKPVAFLVGSMKAAAASECSGGYDDCLIGLNLCVVFVTLALKRKVTRNHHAGNMPI
jgi:hypothetical protein